MSGLALESLRAGWNPGNLGLSIGGWDPFSGGLKGILELGTINGEPVLSGGLAGVASHLEQVANGVTVDVLGSSVGGALNSLTNALDAPIIDATSWIDANKTLVIAVVAAVGIAILCPYAFGAWSSMLPGADIDAAIDADALAGAGLGGGVTVTTGDVVAPLTEADLASAPAFVDTDALGASATAGTSSTAGTVSTAEGLTDTGANTGALEANAANATSTGSLGTSATSGTSLTADGSGISNVIGGTELSAQGATQAALLASAPVVPSALGTAIQNALVSAAVGVATTDLVHLATGTAIPASTPVPAVTTPSSIPIWVYLAAGAAALYLLVSE